MDLNRKSKTRKLLGKSIYNIFMTIECEDFPKKAHETATNKKGERNDDLNSNKELLSIKRDGL